MILLRLTARSLWHRRTTALLTLITIGFSVMLFLGVEKVRTETRNSFANTLSGADLIVGARSGQIQLLLYSIFRIGDATSNISWQSYELVKNHKQVAWTVPISLGDSHKGFRVLGTTQAYFDHYRYGNRHLLRFDEGRRFEGLYDVVLGAEVADKLGYKVGSKIVVAHGIGSASFSKHDDKPFRVVGVLERTGTPVDRTLHVSLEALEAIHIDWKAGVRIPGKNVSAEEAAKMELQPKQITAFLVGMKSKVATFHLQRSINNYRKEPMLAILPGVALQQLWDMVGIAEKALMLVSAIVVIAGLVGMLTVILTSLNERRREMAILRSVGARAWQVLFLLTLESALLTLMGVGFGILLLYGGIAVAQPVLESHIGVFIPLTPPSMYQWNLLGLVVVCGTLVGLIPGYRAYRYSVADGMTIRI